MSEFALLPSGCQYRALEHHLPKADRSPPPPPLNSSGSLMILFLFTELIQLQMRPYNMMPKTRIREFSWNTEEVVGGAQPAPAAHQHSGRAAALSGIPGIQLGWGKNNCHCFFLKFHLTTVTRLRSSAQILTCVKNTSVKQLKLNVHFAGVPLFAQLPLLPSVRLPHWSFLQGKTSVMAKQQELRQPATPSSCP